MGNKANKTAIESPPQTKLKRDEPIPATNAKEAIERKGYVIVADIGQGGFGKVYKVREKETNEEFAIKETPFLGENGYDQTMREVANGCILNHPNIIKFFEYFINRGTNKLYITMELCEYNLRKWFQQNTRNRSYTEAIRMIRQITAGIEYVHGKNIMHRDLKPENILITNNGQTCKIVDFGLSAVHTSKHSYGKGSLLYVSPEQFNQESYDFKTDVFPLGIIVMEFFTVFDSEKQWLEAIINIQHPHYSKLPKQFFERHKLTSPKKYIEAQNLVMAMTKVHPDQRPTVTEVIKHPFFAVENNVNAPKPEPSQPEKNDRGSNDRNELRRLVQGLILLNLLKDNDDGVNNNDKDIVESDKEDVNNIDKDVVEIDEDVNQTINKTLREIVTQRESNNEREIPESDMLNRIIKQLTYQRINQRQTHRENTNNDEKNRVLCEIISQGQKRRQKILDDIEEKNRMILDIMARRETQLSLLRDEMQEDLRVILDIVMDGDPARSADISLKKTLNDMQKIIMKGFMNLKKVQDLEMLNRKITELMSENQFHRSIYDTMGTKILTLLTRIPAESKADGVSESYKSSVNTTDTTVEEITLSACERYIDNVQLLGRSLTALYYILKSGKNKFQNINRALDFVLRVMIQYPKDTNIQIPATASLSHIVRSEASKHHTDIEVKRKIITQTLNIMHLHQDDMRV
jgi:serine/threonine protein kinase